MSGGHYGYIQYRLDEVIEQLTQDIKEAFKSEQYSTKLAAKISETRNKLIDVQVLLNRIDWVLSGDDSEEDFWRRLDEDIKEQKMNKY